MFPISHEFKAAVDEAKRLSDEISDYSAKGAFLSICIALKEIEIKFAEMQKK